MQIIKFIKHSYKYYKGDNDTSADIDQIFGFVQALDKKRNFHKNSYSIYHKILFYYC